MKKGRYVEGEEMEGEEVEGEEVEGEGKEREEKSISSRACLLKSFLHLICCLPRFLLNPYGPHFGITLYSNFHLLVWNWSGEILLLDLP